MQIDPNCKYACWFFGHAWVGDDWPVDNPVAGGGFAARGLDIRLGDEWVRWIGSLVNDEIRAGGLALYVPAPVRGRPVYVAVSRISSERPTFHITAL